MAILEEIADRFIEDVLRDHPIMMYSLDYELREFLSTIKGRKYSGSVKRILREDNKGNEATREMSANELVGAVVKEFEPSKYEDDEELLNTMKQEYLQSIAAHGSVLFCKLIQLVMKSNKVRIRSMQEFEETEQEDAYMPNVWAYHKNWKSKDVVNYIRGFYDSLRQEEEIEEEDAMK